MQQRTIDPALVAPGMDVCDLGGEKVGAVARVHRGSPAHGDVVEVKTGFLGLGKHLYIPIGAIQDMTEGCLFLRETRAALEHEHHDWWSRPPGLDEST